MASGPVTVRNTAGEGVWIVEGLDDLDLVVDWSVGVATSAGGDPWTDVGEESDWAAGVWTSEAAMKANEQMVAQPTVALAGATTTVTCPPLDPGRYWLALWKTGPRRTMLQLALVVQPGVPAEPVPPEGSDDE